MRPTRSFSLSIGTASTVRIPARSAGCGNGQWITVKVGTTRTKVSGLDRLPRFGGAGQSDIRAGTEQSSAPQLLHISGRQSTVERHGSEGVSFGQPHSAVAGLA